MISIVNLKSFSLRPPLNLKCKSNGQTIGKQKSFVQIPREQKILRRKNQGFKTNRTLQRDFSPWMERKSYLQMSNRLTRSLNKIQKEDFQFPRLETRKLTPIHKSKIHIKPVKSSNCLSNIRKASTNRKPKRKRIQIENLSAWSHSSVDSIENNGK